MDEFLVWGAVPLIVSWLVWTALNVLATLLVTLVALKRLFVAGRPHDPPIARPAAAIGLGIMLGMMWKFALALVGVLVIATFVPGLESTDCRVDIELSVAQFGKLISEPISQTGKLVTLPCVKEKLIHASAFNSIAIILVLAAVLGVVLYRAGAKRLFRKQAAAGTLNLPRLIANPLIIATLFAGAWLAIASFILLATYEIDFAAWLSKYLPWLSGDEKDGAYEAAGEAMLALLVFFFFVRLLADRSGSVVHIGRDLVDHQYDWSPRGLPLPVASEEDSEISRYRRRKRIQRRLEALIDEVIARQKVDRLIFLAHSQGTVILHDYLVNHDNLVRRTHAAEKSLYTTRRIDVVTMGSPLKHIYRHYFPDYDRPRKASTGKKALIERVDSWTNMWRVDDPIGQDVELASVDLKIENVGIGPGGHTNYWREDAVCAKLWSLISLDTP